MQQITQTQVEAAEVNRPCGNGNTFDEDIPNATLTPENLAISKWGYSLVRTVEILFHMLWTFVEILLVTFHAEYSESKVLNLIRCDHRDSSSIRSD